MNETQRALVEAHRQALNEAIVECLSVASSEQWRHIQCGNLAYVQYWSGVWMALREHYKVSAAARQEFKIGLHWSIISKN